MSALVAMSGWLVALALAARGRAVREAVARAVHEVRGPLHAAGLVAETLARRAEVPADIQYALDAQLRRAGGALQDLLAAPGLRVGEDRPRRLRVPDLAEDVARAWAPAVAASGRRLRLVPGPEDAAIVADAGRVAQVAGNLIANAIEHGEGDVELRLRRAPGVIRLEVADDGAGVPAGAGDLGAGPAGTRGRGLAIAADIARRHGGRLVAEGNIVALELPPAPEAA